MTDKTPKVPGSFSMPASWASAAKTTSINVCCLKWGAKYSADYVNRLAAMVRKNLSRPHRFICFTDDPAGIHPSVECRVLLDEGMTGWWHKLSFFKSDIHDLEGTLLFLDLDIVIVSDIDPLFEYPGNFCIIRDWLHPSSFNSSVFRMEIGTQAHVYNEFLKFGPQNAAMLYPGDQEWISQQIPDATVWPDLWCASFKWQCAVPRPDKPIIPAGAKIIVFHGKPNPHEAMGSSYRIYGPKNLVPHDNMQGAPASWIADFWNVDGLENADESAQCRTGKI